MEQSMTFPALFKKPSAFMPVAMSLAAFIVVISHIMIYGAMREADEGTAAHLFQLLLIAQMPIVALFAIRWLAKFPRQALMVLALQAAAGLAALAPVFIFKL